MKIEWTEPAVTDLTDIHNYIARDSEYYANQFIGKIIEAVESLEQFPARGRIVPEVEIENIRELLFCNYRIIYRPEPERILVLTIIHGSRDMNRTEAKPWEIS